MPRLTLMKAGARPLPPGHVIGGGHIIESVLGQGGFGITYKARAPDGEVVAIKEYCPQNAVARTGDALLPKRPHDDTFRSGYAYFKEEAETLRKLPRHPNIVGVRALFEKNNTVYMLMDFIDGQPLQARLRTGRPFSEEETRNLLGQMTMALGLLHDQRVLHCDIKPQNIMIRRTDDVPVLIDFGAVRDLRRAGSQIEVLTEGYAPIEMLDRSIGRLGPWSDIYSLGVVGYYMVAGRKPPSALARLKTIRAGQIDPLDTCVARRRRGISEQIAKVVDACLKLDPAERPVSAATLAGLLRQGQSEQIAPDRFHVPQKLCVLRIARTIHIRHIVSRRSSGPSNSIPDPPPSAASGAGVDRISLLLCAAALVLLATIGYSLYALA